MTTRTSLSNGHVGVSGLLPPLVAGLGSLVKAGVREQPFQRDPAFIARIFPLLKAVHLYFGTAYRGWRHVPRDTPCLIVGNHSGGAESNDFTFLLYKWVQERGAAAPLYSLAYNLLFGVPGAGTALRRVGIIPASHANARKALAMGATVSVFPGGDHEVFRPWRERNRIDFGGRTGFITLAIAAAVPVVPMTIHGAHQSTLVLTRGRALAHAAGLDRLHVNIFPWIWNIPFGPTPAFVPSLQLPSKVTVHFGAPLDWSKYRRQAHDPAVLRACYDEITARMQSTLNRLARAHPHPVVERLRELPREIFAHSANAAATGAAHARER
jgi:1-acyl-sn-glycerol-3-phosphate acyltransferase